MSEPVAPAPAAPEIRELVITLFELGREITAVLDLPELLQKIPQLIARITKFQAFAVYLLDPKRQELSIAYSVGYPEEVWRNLRVKVGHGLVGAAVGEGKPILVNDETNELEMKVAVRYGDAECMPRVQLGVGLVGYAALHKEAVLVPDVSKDPRYIKVVEDARSELAIPLMLKDRCIGVFDLESPELDAFTKNHLEILTLLASQAAVAIENARLYETILANEVRLEKEIRFAQRVQAALLPTELPKRLKGDDVAARFAPARDLGGDLYDFLAPESNSLVVAVGDVSGKGVPAALYSAFAGELIRSRTFRRRYAPERFSPAGVLASVNTILHERQLEEYYCTLCYGVFDFKRRTMVLANAGLPYPIRCHGAQCAQIELPGVPLGSFAGSTYDEVTFDLAQGDVFVFCTDGVFEANDPLGREFGASRLLQVVSGSRHRPVRELVDAIFAAVHEFRGDTPPND